VGLLIPKITIEMNSLNTSEGREEITPHSKKKSNKRNSRPTFVSLDVECVATGYGHNDREPCSVFIVSVEREEVILNETFQPAGQIVSYLTELTGITASDFTNASESLSDVMVRVRASLGPNTVIVGQNPGNDIAWLGLVKGVDFLDVIDLSEELKV
jgi:DNA polymerase III epsilon subunit-like protein